MAMADDARAMIDSFNELNKDTFAIEAFADAFIDILRDVSRQQRSGMAGVSELARFFDMLHIGARVSMGDLSKAALERICPSREIGAHTDRERLLIRIAEAGLVYLIEKCTYDGFASARVSKRASDLVAAIENFNEYQNRKALEAGWTRQPGHKGHRSDIPDEPMVQEIRNRIRSKAATKALAKKTRKP